MTTLMAGVERRHSMPFGAEVQADGSVRFRIWAPEASSMGLVLEGHPEPLPMPSVTDGWYEITTPTARTGSRYRFVLPTGARVPDPASRYQPEDVNGSSEVVDPAAYPWQSSGWNGLSWDQAVLYELHLGTFTEEGTFRAAIAKLDHLAELGITAVEIMAVGEFPGRRNWGYDGVLLYAPDSTYGRPEDLKALIEAAHDRGMMIILDVVYNHFGPEGNYLPQYFPQVTTDRYSTPWGQALNFEDHNGVQTREFIVQNALYWIEEFNVDGLRLDAVHAIMDTSPTHILDELAQRVRAISGDRPVHLILESDDTMWHRLARDGEAAPLFCTAQWNHDVQQLSRLAMMPEGDEQEARRQTEHLGKALTEGFTAVLKQPADVPAVLEGAACDPVPPGGFIAFIQTHDLVGNRLRGERISHLASTEIVQALAAVYLMLPQVPMLFMGEEWGATSPFPYFCDFQGDLAEAVRKGRLEQFGAHLASDGSSTSIPDPMAEETFLSAKLHWKELDEPDHALLYSWYRGVLRARREFILPLLPRISEHSDSFYVLGPRALAVQWELNGGGRLRLEANLSKMPHCCFRPPIGRVLWQQGTELSPDYLGAWSVRWSLDDPSDPQLGEN